MFFLLIRISPKICFASNTYLHITYVMEAGYNLEKYSTKPAVLLYVARLLRQIHLPSASQ